MSTVISVEKVSKSYALGQIGTGTFSRDLEVWWARLTGKPNPLQRIGETDEATRSGELLWALRDVSFRVNQGEALGIIGRNGAGKSTLLKILSRVTAPTTGRVKVKGRIASLLEVGTGFHPDLSGRENIYLNGAILGMNRKEIARKFDEIVDFAEVAKFIDTPVKRYSSGMYVRLAFAVAAYLEPEILIVDEVLSVGDAAFQQKCLGKLGAVAGEGRTVLFVSHNLLQMGNLCTRGLWLENGQVRADGGIESVIGSYRKSISGTVAGAQEQHTGFLSWKIKGNTPQQANMLVSAGAFTLELTLKIDQKVNLGGLILLLQNAEGHKIAGWFKPGLRLEPGDYAFTLDFPSLPIRPGIYYWNVAFWDGSRKVDSQILMPELLLATEDQTGLNEEMGGVLNLPCELRVVDQAH